MRRIDDPRERPITFRISKELHARFKTVCALTCQSMQDVILDFIESYVDANKVIKGWMGPYKKREDDDQT